MKALMIRLTCGLLIAALLAAMTGCGSADKSSETEPMPTEPETAATAQLPEPEETAAFREEDVPRPTETAEAAAPQTSEAAAVTKEAAAPTPKTTQAAKETAKPAVTTATSAENEPSNYKEAYRQFLLRYLSSDNASSDGWFGFIYLDNDDIPEMIISQGSFHLSAVSLYAYADSQVKHIDDLGHYGSFHYEPKSGLIYVGDVAQGYMTDALIEYKNGKADVIWSAENDGGTQEDESKTTYKINGKTVTQEEYDKDYKEHVDRHNFTETPFLGESRDAYSLTKENIQSCDQL